jgi:hypothetical protein
MNPRELLRHHVTGAIERGEAEDIIEQPALPGAEAVREVEHATPEFDLPFALTPPENRSTNARAVSLFDAIGRDIYGLERGTE